MPLPRVGTLTIGQAPRPDVAPIIEAHLPPGSPVVHAGVLDGLSASEVATQFGHRPGDRLLVSRLLTGEAVRLDAARIDAGVRVKVEELEAGGCDLIVLLCTGTFSDLACERAWLLEPDRIIPPFVAGLLGDRRLGVIVPDEAQAASEGGKWAGLAQPPVFSAASPYRHDPDAVAAAARSVASAGASAIVLDCIGFTESHRRLAADAAAVPVLLSNAIVARAAGELASAWGTSS